MVTDSYYFSVVFDGGSSGDAGGGWGGLCLWVFPFLDFAGGCDF